MCLCKLGLVYVSSKISHEYGEYVDSLRITGRGLLDPRIYFI